jgi:hypothetical protein
LLADTIGQFVQYTSFQFNGTVLSFVSALAMTAFLFRFLAHHRTGGDGGFPNAGRPPG